MTDAELQAEELTVLPQRLETITCSGPWWRCHHINSGPVHQTSNIHQSNVNNQIGGHCFKANCSQTNVQSNTANVHQNVSRH